MKVDFDYVHDEVQAHVGKVITLDLGTIQARDFQRFAAAAGDLNPLYFDEAAARAAGYPSRVAPPLFLSSVLGWDWGPPEADLRSDGTVEGETLAALPLEGLRLMGAGQELEFHEPVTDGIRVTVEVGVEAVELKHGRSGPFLIMTIARRYLDEDNRLLTTCRERLIGR